MNDDELRRVREIVYIVKIMLKPIEQRLDHADRVRGFNYNRASLIVSIVALLTSIGMVAILLITLVK